MWHRNFTHTLVQYGNIWAIDIEKSFIDATQKRVKKAQVGFGNIETGKYFFGDKTFSSIVCLNVLEHIKDHEKALYNMKKLLRSNGKLVLLVPAFMGLYGSVDQAIGHYRRYHKNDIVSLLREQCLVVEYLRVINFIGALGWWFSGRILKNSSIDKEKLKIFNNIATFILPIEDLLEPPLGTSILIIARKK